MPGRPRVCAPEHEWFECDGCEATMVASRGELHAVHGWRSHGGTRSGGKVWRLLLCASCEAASQPTEAHAPV